MRLSDLDGDGDMDIVATGRSSDKIVWYVNDGLENFTSTVIDNSVNGPGNFVIKDLDEDGDLDLIVAVIDGGNVVWYANNGSQNFGDAININTNFAMCRDLDVVDMDEDGDLDIVALSSDAAGNITPVNNQWASFAAPSPGVQFGIQYMAQCTVYSIWLELLRAVTYLPDTARKKF